MGAATTASTKKTAGRKRAAAERNSASSVNWNLRRARGLQILEAPALARLDWLVHGFSTRPGGASELKTPREGRDVSEKVLNKVLKNVLNLGFTDWDSRERVLANRDKFFRGIGAARMRVVALRQIHSDIVHIVNAEGQARSDGASPSKPALQGDALITRERGVLLVVQTADCIPILLADTKRRAVAAIHSGWRGTARRIAAKTLGRMQMEFGTQPEDVVAALGPGIGQPCYEVGTEVAAEFQAQFPNAREWFDGPFDRLADSDNDPNWLPWLTMKPPGHQPPPPHVQLDLIAANRAILAEAGIGSAKIFASGHCTACRSDLFFSYRKERTTGRLMAAIGIR
ncbi:MAG: peptidoglycan editing factor PgeF [Candidatus Acidiferrales bacterium]